MLSLKIIICLTIPMQLFGQPSSPSNILLCACGSGLKNQGNNGWLQSFNFSRCHFDVHFLSSYGDTERVPIPALSVGSAGLAFSEQLLLRSACSASREGIGRACGGGVLKLPKWAQHGLLPFAFLFEAVSFQNSQMCHWQYEGLPPCFASSVFRGILSAVCFSLFNL